MGTLRILSGGGELFDIPVPEGAALRRVAAAVELLTAGSTGPGRERLAALLEPLFPRKYQRPLFNISGQDALKLGRALLPSFPCPAPAGSDLCPEKRLSDALHDMNNVSCKREVPKLTSRKEVHAPELPRPEKAEAANEDEVIALAFAFKWTLEYAAALPPRRRAKCLDFCRFRRERPDHPETAFTPEELARAVARNAAALEKLRGKEK